MTNYHEYTFYWNWKIKRFTFMIWFMKLRRSSFRVRFHTRSDGGWVLNLPLDVSLMWDGK